MESVLVCLLLPVLGYFCGILCARIGHILPEAILNERSPNVFLTGFRMKERVPKQRLLEVITPLFFSIAWMLQPFGPSLFFSLALFCVLSCCFITDFDHQILPDILTFSLLWFGLLASVFTVRVTPTEAILGAALGYAAPWALNALYALWRGRDGMYPGDFKLNAGIGACLGVNFLLLTIAIAFLLLITTAFLLVFNRRIRDLIPFLDMEMPYGCFASFAAICVYVGSNLRS